jgi:uncharacterized protein (UPF0332 family)
MPDHDRSSLARLRFENAGRCLKSAHVLLGENDYKSAANRSYYAIFYAIRAVLALDGKDYKKHSAVIAHFRKEYIKTGHFQTEFSAVISELFEVRTDSDYDDFFVISKEEVIDQIRNAERFLEAVGVFLIKQGVK